MRTILKLLLMMLFFAPLQVAAKNSSSPLGEGFSYIVITKDSVSKAPVFEDEEFYRLSTSVIFKVNKTDIRPDDEFFNIYRSEILPLVNEKHLQLRKIFIRGAASPEGPYANNQRLARGRSQALLTELKRDLVFQYLDAEVDVNSVTEDYGYLCVLLKNANDKDYDTVKQIYDECNGDELCCKKRLMAYDRGRLWNRLLKEYFPQLRAARLILWFSEPDEEHAPKINVEPAEPLSAIANGITDIPEPDYSLFVPQPEYPVAEKYTRRHLIAARTNLIHDFFYMPKFGWAFSPNIQFEYYPLKGHYTYNIGMTWGTIRKWETHQFWQVRDFQAEVRRYFKGGGKFIGPYLGAFVHGDKYGIGLNDKEGWEGEGGGVGLSVGHTMALNKKGSFRLEFMAAAGFFLTVHDPYVYGNPITGTINGKYYYNYFGSASDFKKRNHLFTWLGPTNLGVQLTYDIIYRKKTIKRLTD